MHNEVVKRMEYIQKVFLNTQQYMQNNPDLNSLINFLESEPPLFRSVAYESASMQIALSGLVEAGSLEQWIQFYHLSKDKHSFHLEIGLGWAFAKTEISPVSYLAVLDLLMQGMIFDGIGYYYGLFKGRRTVKFQQIPEIIRGDWVSEFDQGLGRRLWYLTQGNVTELAQRIEYFQLQRQKDLWRGVGIACGYVGGCDAPKLEQLATHAAGFKPQLRAGIALAALSRSLSNSLTSYIELACHTLCGLPPQKVLQKQANLLPQINSESQNFSRTWITQLEEEFS